MFRKTLVIPALISSALIATVAQSHAKAAADAVVAELPKAPRLTFNKSLITKFHSIELKTEKDKVETGTAVANPIDNKQLIVPPPAALADGVYSIKWHAVSEDTQPLDGTYSFMVKR